MRIELQIGSVGVEFYNLEILQKKIAWCPQYFQQVRSKQVYFNLSLATHLQDTVETQIPLLTPFVIIDQVEHCCAWLWSSPACVRASKLFFNCPIVGLAAELPRLLVRNRMYRQPCTQDFRCPNSSNAKVIPLFVGCRAMKP